MSRTRSPTATASSTSEASIRGVDTATSTPHASSNSHSLRGSLTRATTRGTANSDLASRLTTTLALSSPVAATTTSYSSRCTDSSSDSSHASPRCQRAAGIASMSTCSGLRSNSMMSCPFSMSSRAIERPTAPAPAITTFIRLCLSRPFSPRPCLSRPFSPRPCLSRPFSPARILTGRQCGNGERLGDPTRDGRYVHLVAGLDHGLGLGQKAVPEPDHERHPRTGRVLQVGGAVAHPVFVQWDLGHADIAGRVAPFRGFGLAGQDVEQAICGPRHGRHRGDAEPLVHRCALGVVDACHHALYTERR